MSRLRETLEQQEANALSLAAYFRAEINKLDKPQKPMSAKLIAVKQKGDRLRQKRYVY